MQVSLTGQKWKGRKVRELLSGVGRLQAEVWCLQFSPRTAPGFPAHHPLRAEGLGRNPWKETLKYLKRQVLRWLPVEGGHQGVANITVSESERMSDLVSCRHQKAHLTLGILKRQD